MCFSFSFPPPVCGMFRLPCAGGKKGPPASYGESGGPRSIPQGDGYTVRTGKEPASRWRSAVCQIVRIRRDRPFTQICVCGIVMPQISCNSPDLRYGAKGSPSVSYLLTGAFPLQWRTFVQTASRFRYGLTLTVPVAPGLMLPRFLLNPPPDPCKDLCGRG